jgi:hypothetical protein
MQCSSLNQHLYRKNIVDSPNCICGLTESTTHYLFHSLRYTAQRQMYIHSINVHIKLTTEILLFGSPKLAPNQNVELFLAVQNIVIASRQCSYGINVGLRRNTAFVIWNGEFAQ